MTAIPPKGARRGVAERIAEQLKAAIVKGRFRPGDALPSERDLAEKYDVNRSSVREAVRRLEAWGLVQVRHGGATRVTDYLLNAGMEMLPSLIEVGGKVDPDILRDLHDIRGMLLGWCAERAAQQADAASLARLDELARGMADPKAKPEKLQELDYDFFEELVRISGNRILLLVSNVVRDVYLKGRERFAPLYARGVFDASHHQRAVEAIRVRDGRTAGEAMRAHAATALKTVEA
jgi:GntR family transcriptional regulator, transcriptional repressor for pyruvate dehydrogenase complex